jgi:crotonobetainyl-CoA:carnitine CoA-transferase CaiB-like acyl-CoA transferase
LPPWTLPLELEANSISFAPIRRPEELVEDPHLLQAKLTM